MVSALPPEANKIKYPSVENVQDSRCFQFPDHDLGQVTSIENNESNGMEGRSTRRQWSVQHEPKSILKRLRSQLAEDGCPESQYSMAIALLEYEEDADYTENCQQAVFWLTQSSLQGSHVATLKLQDCLDNAIGICEQNYQDVIACLRMDLQEKLAIVAARQLFYCLSEGNEFVSLRKLNEKVSEIVSANTHLEPVVELSKETRKLSLEQTFGSDRLTETTITNAAKCFVKGNIPDISIDIRSTNNTLISWRTLENFHRFLLLLIHSPLEMIFTTSYSICIIVIAWCLSYAYVGNIFLVCSCTLLIFSFCLMLYSVSEVLYHLFNFQLFRLWSTIFQNFSPNLNIDQPQKVFDWKLVNFYSMYFLGLFIYLCLVSVVPRELKTLLLPILTFTSFLIAVSLWKNNFSFNVLSLFLWFMAQSSDTHVWLREIIVDVHPSVENYLHHGSMIVEEIFPVYLTPTLFFYCLWFTVVIVASWSLGIKSVSHHLLCISWLRMITATTISLDSWFLYACCFWVTVISLYFAFSFVCHLLLAGILPLCVLSLDGDRIVSLVIFISISFILVYVHLRFLSTVARLVKLSIVLIGSCVLLYHHLESSHAISSLKWEQYQSICLPMKPSSTVLNARNCSPLKGTVIQWQAIVKHVEVESVTNWARDLASLLPHKMKSQLECLLGEEGSQCGVDQFLTDDELEQCLAALRAVDSQCSLQRWNQYSFRIIVSMESNFWKFRETTDVVLEGSHHFRETAFKLFTNDRISFVGYLTTGVARGRSSTPEVVLLALSCADCRMDSPDVDTRPSFDGPRLFRSLGSTLQSFLGRTWLA